MDEKLERDSHSKLQKLTEQPDMDLHLRLEEHRIEGYIWLQGRRYRIMGIRDRDRRPMKTPATEILVTRKIFDGHPLRAPRWSQITG